MKVLFAVHDEKVSSSIVKKYQKDFKEIISFKNVYYFNAILKELQKDKTYDRIVIDEELEEFTSSSFEQKDKFIFDKLDKITDEATNSRGNDTPIILICSDRRVKSEEVLVKLFGLGIYNAIVGNDRSTDEVCKLINKPRTKKEAKIYYKIDVDDVKYKHEDENDVSEEELQHIISYFKKLGKNEDRYVECFSNILSQYNEKQMKVIILSLPLHVKSILEANSPEYQKIATGTVGRVIKKPDTQSTGASGVLLTGGKPPVSGAQVIVPSKMENTLVKGITKRPTKIDKDIENINEDESEEIFEEEIRPEKPKRRGRPPKKSTEGAEEKTPEKPKRRGRPPKKLPEETENIISEIDDEEDAILPGLEAVEETILPGMEAEEEETILPGMEIEEKEATLPGIEMENEEKQSNNNMTSKHITSLNNVTSGYLNKQPNQDEYHYDFTEYTNLLSSSKKVITFVGTSKNGTSFIVNNIAKILADGGIDTAILDTTQNKNSYFIYTKNDEELRVTSVNCMNNLINGKTEGIPVQENLTVYTEPPAIGGNIYNAGPILENLIKRYSAVLIDCDFNTPYEYFKRAQEIYLVQSMDVLTIQPLTAFLRELKSRDIIKDNNIKVILDKFIKLKGVRPETIVGGIAYYNDPEMSFMTELFDKDSIVPIQIPFDLDVYQSYLQQLIDCEISIERYPKEFQIIIKDLAFIVYPLLPSRKSKIKKGYQYEAIQNNSNYSNSGFSDSINNTLNNMKKNINK